MKSIMKLLLPALLVSAAATAQKVAVDAKPGEVIVKGKIGNVNAPVQLWIYMGNEMWDTVPIKNGEFEYRKTTKLPAYGAIRLNYIPYYQGSKQNPFADMNLISVFFEAGTMTVTSPVDTLKKYAVVKGSALHTKYQEFWDKEGAIIREQKKLAAVFNSASPEQLQSEAYQEEYEKKNDALLKRWDRLIRDEIKKYPNSLHTVMAFWGYKRTREPDSTTLISLVDGLGDAYREYVRSVVLESIKESRMPVIETGSMAPVFVQQDQAGKPLKLSDLRGKYVLIDFWASWCGPCRKVNPELVKLYQKFKSPAFEILGVSLDENDAKWKEAIEKDQLGWLHVSDLKGWKNEVAEQYGIRAVPQNFLLDPSGKVVAKNLKVDELEAELNKLLK